MVWLFINTQLEIWKLRRFRLSLRKPFCMHHLNISIFLKSHLENIFLFFRAHQSPQRQFFIYPPVLIFPRDYQPYLKIAWRLICISISIKLVVFVSLKFKVISSIFPRFYSQQLHLSEINYGHNPRYVVLASYLWPTRMHTEVISEES